MTTISTSEAKQSIELAPSYKIPLVLIIAALPFKSPRVNLAFSPDFLPVTGSRNILCIAFIIFDSITS